MMAEDFVSVKSGQNEYMITIKPHWRTIPEDEGIALLKEKIYRLSGFRPAVIKNNNGVIIESLDFISPQDVIHVEELPPQYEHSLLNANDLFSTKEILRKICRALEIPLDVNDTSSDMMVPFMSRISALENKVDELSNRLSENTRRLEENSKNTDTKYADSKRNLEQLTCRTQKDLSKLEVSFKDLDAKCLDVEKKMALTDRNMQNLEEDSKRQKMNFKDIENKYTMVSSRLDEVKLCSSELKEKLSRVPVAPNLIRNSLMRNVCSGIPTGYVKNTWSAGGNVEIQAVHPFTHGFEGSYTPTAPEKSVSPGQCALAAKDRPVFYGRYNMGPRLTRGGLSTGWHGITDGHVLKLSGTRIYEHEAAINLPAVSVGAASLIRFVAWIKCVKGAVAFSVDYPNWPNPMDLIKQRKMGVCRTEDCQSEPQGWFKMDDVISISNIVKLNGGHSFLLRCFGPVETGGLGDFEIYVALPYASLVEEQHKVAIVPSPDEF